MNEKPTYESIRKKYNIPDPPAWTGYTGGVDPKFSIAGKWQGIGQGGIESYDDKTQTLYMNHYGIHTPIKMQAGTPTEYIPSVTKEEVIGRSTISDYDQQLAGSLNSVLNEDPTYNVPLDSMQRIRDMATGDGKGNIKLEDIMHRTEFDEALKFNKLIKGKTYYVPAMQNEGNIDFQMFMADPPKEQ